MLNPAAADCEPAMAAGSVGVNLATIEWLPAVRVWFARTYWPFEPGVTVPSGVVDPPSKKSTLPAFTWPAAPVELTVAVKV